MNKDNFLIYVVEDNEWYNKLLVHTLSLNPEFSVQSYENATDLLKALKEEPHVITLDYRLPDMDGEKLLHEVKSRYPEIEVLVISEQEDVNVALNLLKAGAYDYLVKTEDIRDKLLNTVSHIQRNLELRGKVERLQKEVAAKYDFQKTIIGKSASIKEVFERIKKSLTVNLTVCISGETGTGKELVAKAIHYNSTRKNKPFVAVNLAAIPSELMESELFGHEKGSFTGAASRRKGKFEEANGGTILLDEIGEVSESIQKKLLRVLQEKELNRVGSNELVKVDCRVITATHKDLQEEVRKGRFREDLFYRLFGIPIHIPPLRERDGDILLLAQHFLHAFVKENLLEVQGFAESARNKLLAYHWPGNVRELKSVVELAAVMCAGAEIRAEDLTFTNNVDPLTRIIGEDCSLREYNQKIVQIYMEKYHDDTKKVASALKIGQSTVYRLLKEIDDK